MHKHLNKFDMTKPMHHASPNKFSPNHGSPTDLFHIHHALPKIQKNERISKTTVTSLFDIGKLKQQGHQTFKGSDEIKRDHRYRSEGLGCLC